ncbi:SIS domain-containing protein [Paenibacillus hamazuiensis]|uniref:SIS domain-containing protein n=1 Tax=Paenibacillus hamazuiensis TaxID=2936508 RepID=UPI00200F80F0|nr:SIS domain-containing protein [Paenibacillus hamazuiensis]
MNMIQKYGEYLMKHLEKAVLNQQESILQAAQLVKKSILAGGRFYVFGSGHSHMIAEELYNRAGGLALIKAILEPSLMLHEEPNKSTYLERLEGYAEVLLNLKEVGSKDTVMIVSNSGRNAVVVEMAIKARELGAGVIAMTSMSHSSKVSSRHQSGKRLFELADVILDNGAETGDAAFFVEGLETPTGPTSSFAGIALAQTMLVTILNELVAAGFEPPVFKSSNLDGADQYNDLLFKTYVK